MSAAKTKVYLLLGMLCIPMVGQANAEPRPFSYEVTSPHEAGLPQDCAASVNAVNKDIEDFRDYLVYNNSSRSNMLERIWDVTLLAREKAVLGEDLKSVNPHDERYMGIVKDSNHAESLGCVSSKAVLSAFNAWFADFVRSDDEKIGKEIPIIKPNK
jgi:hypothetical protein